MKPKFPLRYFVLSAIALLFAIVLYFSWIKLSSNTDCYPEYERYRTTGLSADSAKICLAKAKTPEDSLFYLGVYIFLQSYKRTDVCLPEIKQILRLTQKHPCELCTAQAFEYLSAFPLEKGGAEVAERRFDSLARVSKDSVIKAYHYFFLTKLALSKKHRVKQMQLLLKCNELLDKEAPHARLLIAQVKIRLNRMFIEDKAQELLKETLSLPPNQSWPGFIVHNIQLQRFNYFMLMGKYDSARALLSRFTSSPYQARQWSIYYHKLKYLDSLKVYLKRDLARWSKTEYSIVRPLTELAELYLEEGNLDSAKVMAKETLVEAIDKDEKNYTAPGLSLLIKTLLKQHQYDSALVVIDQFEQFAKKNNFLHELVSVYHLRSDYYEKINRPDLALQAINTSYAYQKKYDSLAGHSEVQRLFFEKYADKQKEIVSILSNQKRSERILFTIALILSLFSIISLVFNIKQRISQTIQVRSFNQQLIELNGSLETRVAERTKELEQKNQQLTNFAFINAHKLRAPVATLLGLIYLYKHNGLNENEREAFLNQVDQLTERLDGVIREMQRSLE